MFDFIFDFLTWQELGRLARVSKYYYSNILVRCRHTFVNHTPIGQSNATINNNLDGNELKVAFSDVKDLCLNRNSKDEMFLYSKDCRVIRSISFDSSYQNPLSTLAME